MATLEPAHQWHIWISLVDHRHQITPRAPYRFVANPRNLMCLLRERPQKQAYADPHYLIYIDADVYNNADQMLVL
jgi:hypothetical protein